MKVDIVRAGNRRASRKGSVQNSLPYIKGCWEIPVPSDRRGATLHEHNSGAVSSLDAPDMPPLMTVEELAFLLQASKGSVYARLARGGIPGALRLGRTLRFDRRVIVQWLSANSTSAGGQS